MPDENVPLSRVTFCCWHEGELADDDFWVEGEPKGEWLIAADGLEALRTFDDPLEEEEVEGSPKRRALRLRRGSRGVTFGAETRDKLEEALGQRFDDSINVEPNSGGGGGGGGPRPIPPTPPPVPLTDRAFCAPTRPPACPPGSRQPGCPI